ncbi:MAG: hypothetical protein LLG09_07090 [Negativicutes bacterium]|nr:hypothetical protein [Negativicutes bacterium]
MKKTRKTRSSRRRLAKKRRRFVLKVFICLLTAVGLFFLIRGGITLYRSFNLKMMRSEQFSETKLIVSHPSEGVILRDETVVVSPYSGKWQALCAEGSSLTVAGQAAEIYDYAAIRKYEDALQKIAENRLHDLNSFQSKTEYYTKTIQEVDTDIANLTKQKSSDKVRNDPDALSRIDKQIETLEANKLTLQAEKEALSDNRATWDAEEALIQTALKKDAKIVTTPYEGIVSFICDGYEGLLSTTSVGSITLQDLKSFRNASVVLHQREEEITAGHPLFKVIKTPWYWCTAYENNYGLQLQAGDTATLLSSLGNQIKTTVESIELLETAAIVTYRFDQLLPEALSDRFQSMALIETTATGYDLPLAAIVSKGKIKGVYCVESGVVTFQAVEVLQERDARAYVSGLSGTKEIILNPRFAIEGILVSGE